MLAALALLSACATSSAGLVPVRYREGAAHSFLSLRSMSGEELAIGEMQQLPRKERVETRLTFTFKDGSIHDESVTYSQQGPIWRIELASPRWPEARR